MSDGLPLFGLEEGPPRDLVTRRDLAAALNVHMMTITKWEREGMPVARHGRRGRPSWYQPTEVRAWLQQREDAMRAPGGALDLITERARRERAQAALAEQAYEIRSRTLLPREEVERLWLAEITAVRAKLLAWPTTLADQVHRIAILDGLPGVERMLQQAVDDVLTELSSPAAAPPRPKTKRRNGTAVRP